ncbi:SOS response-associated peptidase [Paenibacillus sp. 1001270B_150601_E10]|uniref:SOS response-associated peptidase n=1 Tax=Paenibacillus sp. 1001270B_150601_E10 TaxID=2787079 RepID=UPI00189F52EE|nr:SOS response-associated peptidase [Paenibacillus sp. 1001270B_150601_E10]
MCRQYSISSDFQEVHAYFAVDHNQMNYRPRYNIIPTQSVPAVYMKDGKRTMLDFRWGLVPFWAPDAVNADLLSVYENEAYRKVIEKQRCVIPCNGFYYWRKEEKRMHPVRVVLRTQGIFALAGLYECWRSAKGEVHRTCTILMTRANDLIGEFDRRMPAVLESNEIAKWLEPDMLEVEYLNRMLKPLPADRFRAYPVSPQIQHAHMDELSCIQEMDLKQAWVKS